MFTPFTEIDERMKIRVLLSWKARVVMEKDEKYRERDSLNKIYSDFCNIIHANNNNISTLRLRLQLIKILNIDKSLIDRVKNFCNNIFSNTLGISEMDREKIIISWNLRTKLEKNKNYIYSKDLKGVYEHLSNILHGEVEKHNMSYVKQCENKVEKFFTELKGLYTYRLKGRKTNINLQNIENFRKKKLLTNKRGRISTIYFFKSTFNGRRIAFVEDDDEVVKKLLNNKYVILKYKSKDIGTFEFVDSSNFYTFVNAKKLKKKNHYQFFN